jgi:hypothetical protein
MRVREFREIETLFALLLFHFGLQALWSRFEGQGERDIR